MLGAAALFSTGGAAIKAVQLGGWQVASLRSGVAALALLAIVPAARRRPTVRVLAVAATYALTMILFVLANKLTTAASTIFLQSTAPLYVLLLSPWLLGERLRRRDLVYMAVLALGLGMLFAGLDSASATAPDPLRGNALAALSGLTWALTIIGLRALGRAAPPGLAGEPRRTATTVAAGVDTAPDHAAPELAARGELWWGEAAGEAAAAAPVPRASWAAAAAAVWGNVLACAAALPLALPLAAGRPLDWLVIAFLGVFQIGCAYALLTRGIGHLRALEASLLLLLEPVLNPIWAWLAHGERPGPWALGGGALILAATVVQSLARVGTRLPK